MTTNKNDLFASLCTIKEMLVDRGVADVSELQEYTCEKLYDMSIRRSIFSIDVANGKTRIIYHLAPKYKLLDVRKHVEDQKGTFDNWIIVTKDGASNGLTVAARRQLDELETVVDGHIDRFHITELLFNISKHTLVPKHEPVRGEADIQAVMQRYGLKTRHQLPLILKTDAMAKYLGLRPGQLVKVTRHSQAAGEYVLYRCCV